MKWGFNFIGPIKPTIRLTWNKYIIVDTNYVTKRVEAKPLKTNIEIVIFVWVYIDEIWMSSDHSYRSRDTFHQWYNQTYDKIIFVKTFSSTIYYP
jgi:hypothetical protein